MKILKSEGYEEDFSKIYEMIEKTHISIWRKVNQKLISLYCAIGEYVSQKTKDYGWGRAIVGELAKYIHLRHPTLKGFSDRNIWRMKQFYETYKDFPKLSAVLTEITWTNHLHILSKTKTLEEKQFYLALAEKTTTQSGSLPELLIAALTSVQY